MKPFRLAHYSDIHVTVPPLSLAPGTLRGKRLVGALNYAVSRRRHFKDVEVRISALLEDVDAQAPDHALCTGDVTAIAAREEFERCGLLFGDRRRATAALTLLPGNHDRYTVDAVRDRLFEAQFDDVCAGPAGGAFPFVKHLREDVTLVVADVTRPCGLLDSSGRCGEQQLERLRELLASPALRGRFVVLAMHYGLLRSRGERDRPRHGIRDDLQLLALLARDDVQVDLVLHGHMHRPYAVKLGKRLAICAGSATDLHGRCGWNVYELDTEARAIRVRRRVWSADAATYVPTEDSPYAPEFTLEPR